MASKPQAAAKAKQTTISTKQLAASLAEDHEIPKKQAEALLGDLVGLVSKHLKKGDRIRIGGLGILQVRKRAARMGRNPATGEAIQIKASKKVAYRPAKELKESVRDLRWLQQFPSDLNFHDLAPRSLLLGRDRASMPKANLARVTSIDGDRLAFGQVQQDELVLAYFHHRGNRLIGIFGETSCAVIHFKDGAGNAV